MMTKPSWMLNSPVIYNCLIRNNDEDTPHASFCKSSSGTAVSGGLTVRHNHNMFRDPSFLACLASFPLREGEGRVAPRTLNHSWASTEAQGHVQDVGD